MSGLFIKLAPGEKLYFPNGSIMQNIDRCVTLNLQGCFRFLREKYFMPEDQAKGPPSQFQLAAQKAYFEESGAVENLTSAAAALWESCAPARELLYKVSQQNDLRKVIDMTVKFREENPSLDSPQ